MGLRESILDHQNDLKQKIEDSFEKGVYKDNSENKRKHRIGQHYGGKKVENDQPPTGYGYHIKNPQFSYNIGWLNDKTIKGGGWSIRNASDFDKEHLGAQFRVTNPHQEEFKKVEGKWVQNVLHHSHPAKIENGWVKVLNNDSKWKVWKKATALEFGKLEMDAGMSRIGQDSYVPTTIPDSIKKEQISIKAMSRSISGKDTSNPDNLEAHEVIAEAYRTGGAFKGKDTLDIYSKGGYYNPEFTPERTKLHDSIVEAYLAKGHKPEGKPISVMMGGAPASGKSSVLKAGLVDVPDGLVTLDADEMKAQLPEYQIMSKAKNAYGAAFAHEESSYLTKRVLKESTGKGYGVLVDGTGNTSVESVKKKVAQIKAAGHRVVANYVTLDTALSLKNNKERFLKTGRKVPEEYVKGVSKSIPSIIEECIKQNIYDELHLFDTNINGQPRKILDMVDGKLTMHDIGLYNKFLAKKYE